MTWHLRGTASPDENGKKKKLDVGDAWRQRRCPRLVSELSRATPRGRVGRLSCVVCRARACVCVCRVFAKVFARSSSDGGRAAACHVVSRQVDDRVRKFFGAGDLSRFVERAHIHTHAYLFASPMRDCESEAADSVAGSRHNATGQRIRSTGEIEATDPATALVRNATTTTLGRDTKARAVRRIRKLLSPRDTIAAKRPPAVARAGRRAQPRLSRLRRDGQRKCPFFCAFGARARETFFIFFF